MDLRKSPEVLDDIKSLVKEDGFIYALCLILVEDFHFTVDQMHKADIRARLSKNEISLLLGFLIQNKISLNQPNSPFDLIDLKKKTRKLMEELHWSTMIPSIEKFKPLIENPEQKPSKEEFFGGENMFIEPIFYAGDGIYDFQYLEYLERKYKYDENWLNENSNFFFDEVIRITTKIKLIHQKKFERVNFFSLNERKEEIIERLKKDKSIPNKKWKRDLDKLLATLEFYQFYELFEKEKNFDKKLLKQEISEKGWTSFYTGLIDLFVIEKSDFDEINISSFFKNFSIPPYSKGRNKQFQNIGDFNIFSAKPLIPLDEDKYFVPISFSIFEAVYESPYYWLSADKSYSTKLAENRGKVGEEITYELLELVFGQERTYKSVKIESKKGFADTDIDVLCILGSKALCVQVKSKKLTQISRKGSYDQIKKDFKGAVQNAYEQALISKERVLERKATFFNENGQKIELSEDIEEVYLLVITTENYPTLTHQSFTLLEKKPENPYPLILTIFDLELIGHYLPNPYDFLYYVRQRVDLMEYFRADEEMYFLGYHLINKLWKNPKYDFVMIDSEFGQLIDRNYYPLKLGIETPSETDKIGNRWKNEEFEKLCQQIDDLDSAKSTDIIFHLLDWSQESRENLIKNIIYAKSKTQEDFQQHNFSILSGPERSTFGLTYISFHNDDLQHLSRRLLTLCEGRKYKSKADYWIGIGSLKNSGRIVDTLVFSEEKWKFNPTLEEKIKVMFEGPNKGKKVKLGRKIGRNEFCPCGSEKKYKKCCGRGY